MELVIARVFSENMAIQVEAVIASARNQKRSCSNPPPVPKEVWAELHNLGRGLISDDARKGDFNTMIETNNVVEIVQFRADMGIAHEPPQRSLSMADKFRRSQLAALSQGHF